MTRQNEHYFLISGTHDDFNRQTYVSNLRMHLLQDIASGMEDVYEHKVKPKFKLENGRGPQQT